MLYWDTSALFAFVIAEKHSGQIRDQVAKQGVSATYTAIITPLEFESAIQRRLSERTLNLREADRARLFGVDFRKRAYLLPLDQNALDTALHLQKIYGLRPGDAIQLASARLGTDNPSRVRFLCLDERLTEAAKLEGFQVD
jgi:predicted nucleic acid-binding protein